MDIQTMDSTWQTFLDDFSSSLDENTCYFDSFNDDFPPFFNSQNEYSDYGYSDSKMMDTKHHFDSRFEPYGKFPVRKTKQRHAANQRERKRMRSINAAFDGLRMRVPASRNDKKISKVDTLKHAIDYIHHLKDLLRASEAHGRQDKKRKVILRCSNIGPTPDGVLLPFAHSLSWQDHREPSYGPNKTVRAKLWVPEVGVPETGETS